MEAVNIRTKYTGMDENTVKLALQNIQFEHRISTSQAIEYIEFLNNLGYTTITHPQRFIQSLILNYEEDEEK